MKRGLLILCTMMVGIEAGVVAPAFAQEEARPSVISQRGTVGHTLDGLLDDYGAEGVGAMPPPASTAVIPDAAPPVTKDWLDMMEASRQLPWLRVLLVFLFIASLVFVCGALLRRYYEKHGKRVVGEKGTLKILQTFPMGMKRHLMVVRFDDAKLLLGVTNNNIELIYSKPDAQEMPQRSRDRSALVVEEDPSPMAQEMRAKEPEPVSQQIRRIVQELRPLSSYQTVSNAIPKGDKR